MLNCCFILIRYGNTEYIYKVQNSNVIKLEIGNQFVYGESLLMPKIHQNEYHMLYNI